MLQKKYLQGEKLLKGLYYIYFFLPNFFGGILFGGPVRMKTKLQYRRNNSKQLSIVFFPIHSFL